MKNAKRLKRQGGTWDFVPGSAEEIASQAAAGQYIYNPPPAPPSIRPRRGKALPRQHTEDAPRAPRPPAPPDLTELRNALAARGMRLEDHGAFFFEIVRGLPDAGKRPACHARSTLQPQGTK